MKRIIAFLAACSCMVSFCACGAEGGVTSEPAINETTTEEAQTETTTSSEEETSEEMTEETAEEESETEKAEAADGIVLADTSGVTVAEVGNYETYLDGFTFPEKYIMDVGIEDGYQMTIGTADDVTLFQMQFILQDEETGEEATVKYAFYSNDTDAYVFMSAFNGEESENSVQHAAVTPSEDDSAENGAMEAFDWSGADVTYVEYLGEQEWNGVTYDTLSAEMRKEEETVPATFWFTKEGEFAKVDFIGDDNNIGTIQAVSSISMPDMTGMEIEEVESEDIAMSMLGAIMMFAFSGMSSAMEEASE